MKSPADATNAVPDVVVTLQYSGDVPEVATLFSLAGTLRSRLAAHGLPSFVSRPVGRRIAISTPADQEVALRRMLIGQLSDLPLREV